jgi:hypothetical protein
MQHCTASVAPAAAVAASAALTLHSCCCSCSPWVQLEMLCLPPHQPAAASAYPTPPHHPTLACTPSTPSNTLLHIRQQLLCKCWSVLATRACLLISSSACCGMLQLLLRLLLLSAHSACPRFCCCRRKQCSRCCSHAAAAASRHDPTAACWLHGYPGICSCWHNSRHTNLLLHFLQTCLRQYTTSPQPPPRKHPPTPADCPSYAHNAAPPPGTNNRPQAHQFL